MTITDEKLAELERRARSRLSDSLDGRPPNPSLVVDPDDVLALVAEVRQCRKVATDAVRMAAARGEDEEASDGE